MESFRNMMLVIVSVFLLGLSLISSAAVDCGTVTSFISACSTFVTYGSPDPIPGSPCCDAVVSLNNLVDAAEDRRSVCRCIMGLIATYNPNATAIATLPGFCGISLGFTIHPNTDCQHIP
uniref:Non-specific lipid-transfer protein n=1 Tax=Kalanchoe fedtschenkoi TaxID=63787 RepID=A0A7N0ZZX4_KALFE